MPGTPFLPQQNTQTTKQGSEIYSDPTERRATLKTRQISEDNTPITAPNKLQSLFEKKKAPLQEVAIGYTEENKENKPSETQLEIHSNLSEHLINPQVFQLLTATPENYRQLLDCYITLWNRLK